ncbi:MAG: hypothetical protein NC453_28370 [Muribaculum sp.]|nr:hypothetical protein [Muribaculum sp.]
MPEIVISIDAARKIRSFYRNMYMKYRNTWDISEIHALIDRYIDTMKGIESTLQRLEPSLSKWRNANLYMARSKDKKWFYAYRFDGTTVYVEDSCHSQNMHENRNVVRLTEQKFKQIIIECVTKILKEIA